MRAYALCLTRTLQNLSFLCCLNGHVFVENRNINLKKHNFGMFVCLIDKYLFSIFAGFETCVNVVIFLLQLTKH